VTDRLTGSRKCRINMCCLNERMRTRVRNVQCVCVGPSSKITYHEVIFCGVWRVLCADSKRWRRDWYYTTSTN